MRRAAEPPSIRYLSQAESPNIADAGAELWVAVTVVVLGHPLGTKHSKLGEKMHLFAADHRFSLSSATSPLLIQFSQVFKNQLSALEEPRQNDEIHFQ